MKKYLPGLFAIVLAVGFSAYTKARVQNGKFNIVYFALERTATGNDCEGYFETPGSWTYLGTTYTECSGSGMACVVEVNDHLVFLGTGTEEADFCHYLQGLCGSGDGTDGATLYVNSNAVTFQFYWY